MGIEFEEDEEYKVIDAQYNLGLYFFYRNYFDEEEKNYQKAAYWMLRAAKDGDRVAQFFIGMMYYDGYGVEKNAEKAAFWLKKAAKRGFPLAEHNLVYCYKNGAGVPQDDKKAAYWYERAEEYWWGEIPHKPLKLIFFKRITEEPLGPDAVEEEPPVYWSFEEVEEDASEEDFIMLRLKKRYERSV